MFDEYFDYGDENGVYLLSGNINMNIEFALASVKSITSEPEYDKKLFCNRFVYYFFHLQSLFTACGNINSTFYNFNFLKGVDPQTKRYDRTLYQNQNSDYQRLRDIYHIDKEHFPLVFNKDFRNTIIHSDERIMEHNANVGDYNILDHHTPDSIVSTILNTPHLRTLDLRTMTYHSYNKQKSHISVNLLDLQDELEKIKINLIKYSPFKK